MKNMIKLYQEHISHSPFDICSKITTKKYQICNISKKKLGNIRNTKENQVEKEDYEGKAYGQ